MPVQNPVVSSAPTDHNDGIYVAHAAPAARAAELPKGRRDDVQAARLITAAELCHRFARLAKVTV
jgi:hypothetical protein